MDDFNDIPTRVDIHAPARANQEYMAHMAAEYYLRRWERDESAVPAPVNEFATEEKTLQLLAEKPAQSWVGWVRDKITVWTKG